MGERKDWQDRRAGIWPKKWKSVEKSKFSKRKKITFVAFMQKKIARLAFHKGALSQAPPIFRLTLKNRGSRPAVLKNAKSGPHTVTRSSLWKLCFKRFPTSGHQDVGLQTLPSWDPDQHKNENLKVLNCSEFLLQFRGGQSFRSPIRAKAQPTPTCKVWWYLRYWKEHISISWQHKNENLRCRIDQSFSCNSGGVSLSALPYGQNFS